LKSGNVLFECGDIGFKSGNGVLKTDNAVRESGEPLFKWATYFSSAATDF